MKNYGFDTKMVHAGYQTEATTNSVTAPIYLTNAYEFNSTKHAQCLFELSEAGNIYSRLSNPTNDVLEQRIAALDGGMYGLTFSSGHAAIFSTIINLANSGDDIVSSISIYGGAINLFGVTLERLGIKTTFVDPDDFDAWESAITNNTRALFVEAVGNPNANVADIKKISSIANKHNIPLIVDSTFTTPYLFRPIEHGADIVIHSATKFLSGHGSVMGGVVVDSGKFNYKDNEKFPLYNSPDVSYHGVVFADLKEAAFITRLRAITLRDVGTCLSPFNAYIILQGVETLSLRMKKHCENAEKIAEFLVNHPKVKMVNYPALSNNKYNSLAKEYLPLGCGSVFTIELEGNKSDGAKFIDNLKLFKNVANVGDIRSLVIHPATTTHSQLSKTQLEQSNISQTTIRLSVGIESVEDLIDDLSNALNY